MQQLKIQENFLNLIRDSYKVSNIIHNNEIPKTKIRKTALWLFLQNFLINIVLVAIVLALYW